MKAGWFFCFSEYDPITMVLEPEWPSGFDPSSLGYVLYDVRRLDSDTAPADHVHQVMGTIAFVNDDLSPDSHYHYVQYFGGSWQQVQMNGGVAHTHPFQTGGVDDVRFLPDYFCIFLYGPDADFDTLVADNKWYLIGESDVTFDAVDNVWFFGDIDNTAFTGPEFTAWQTQFRVALGREMPVEITNPRRLVSWFCPMTAPNMYDWWNESLFRLTSVAV
jgi:hypothetical protein